MAAQRNTKAGLDQASLLDLVRRLIAADTQNPPGNERRATEVALNALAPLSPCDVVRVEFGPERESAIVRFATAKAELEPLVINAHLDVAATDPRSWTRNPLGGEVANGRIIGRGASDMKGGLACVIAALEFLRDTKRWPQRGIEVHLMGDEERGSRMGTGALAENNLLKGYACLIPEPTRLAVCLAERGVLWATITVNRAPNDPGMSHAERSCIRRAAQVIVELQGSSSPTRHALLDSGPCNIGVITGGSSPNSAPTSCSLGVDLRLLPPDTLTSAVDRLRSRVKRTLRDAEFELVVTKYAPASETPSDHGVVQLFQSAARVALGASLPVVGFPGPTDARYYRAAGVPTIVCGPGDPVASHRPDESVSVKALMRATRLYAEFIASC